MATSANSCGACPVLPGLFCQGLLLQGFLNVGYRMVNLGEHDLFGSGLVLRVRLIGNTRWNGIRLHGCMTAPANDTFLGQLRLRINCCHLLRLKCPRGLLCGRFVRGD